VSTLPQRMADYAPRATGHVDVPPGLWEELTGDEASRAHWDPREHPRVPHGQGGGRFTSSPGAAAEPWDRNGDVVTYHGHAGIDRKDMPQLSGVGGDGAYHPSSEMVPQFMEHLRAQGIQVRRRRVSPESLRPTQTTGDIKAIRRIADTLKSGDLHDTKAITVSRDGRVLDGHHNWAGRLLAGREGGRPGLPRGMQVVQVGLPIEDLITQARGFAAQHGIRQRASGEFANPEYTASRGLPWPADELTLGAGRKPA